MAEITVLGAYGTKGDNHETTCFALNDYNVIDAGNLLKGLSDKCADLDTIWLTHSHLDHIADIAYVLDYYFDRRKKPLRIAALPETIKILQKHFLNELIWPDFSMIHLTHSETKAVEYFPIEIGKRYEIGEGEFIEPFQTNHTVPSCGYVVTKEGRSIAITSDTYLSIPVWDIINTRHEVQALVIECSFQSKLSELAKQSKHLTPKLLEMEVKKLKREVDIYINHLKPTSEDIIKKELSEIALLRDATILHDYQKIEF